MKEEGLYQIGEVADRVGLSLRTLRYYEEVGLVEPSERSPGGFRLYGEEDIQRAEFVKQLKPLDFSLDEIRELLVIRDRFMQSSEDVAAEPDLSDRLEMFITAAEERGRILLEQSRAASELGATLGRLLRKTKPRGGSRR